MTLELLLKYIQILCSAGGNTHQLYWEKLCPLSPFLKLRLIVGASGVLNDITLVIKNEMKIKNVVLVLLRYNFCWDSWTVSL